MNEKKSCMCEGSGIKSVVVGSEVVEDFCDCPAGDLLRLENEGADFEDDLPVPYFGLTEGGFIGIIA